MEHLDEDDVYQPLLCSGPSIPLHQCFIHAKRHRLASISGFSCGALIFLVRSGGMIVSNSCECDNKEVSTWMEGHHFSPMMGWKGMSILTTGIVATGLPLSIALRHAPASISGLGPLSTNYNCRSTPSQSRARVNRI